MQEPVVWVSWLAASVVAALCASAGFNRPSWSRSYTTASRFRLARVAFVAAFLLMLLVVYAIVQRGFALAMPDAAPAAGNAVAAMWLALLVVLVLRMLPLSRRLRETFHRLAGVPDSARRLADLLSAAELDAPEPVLEEARAMLLSLGIDSESDWLPITRPLHAQLLNTTVLFVQIRQWTQDPDLASFTREAKHEVDTLRHRFDRMSFRVARTLTSIERLGTVRHLFSALQRSDEEPMVARDESQQLDPLLRKLVNDLIADCCEAIAAFHADACLLASRAVMATQDTRRGRDRLLARLGFRLPQRESRNAYGVLGLALVMLYVGIWLFLTILPANTGGDDAGLELKEKVAVITAIVFGALMIAIVPKLRWGFANAGLHERTPVSFVVGAGLAALLFAVVVNLVSGALLIGGWAGAVMRLNDGAPYLHAPFLTAMTMAWLVQDHRWRRLVSERGRRRRDALVLGAVWAVSGIVVRVMAMLLTGAPLSVFVGTVLGSFVFGAVLGYVIPESVRADYLRTQTPERPLVQRDVAALTPSHAA